MPWLQRLASLALTSPERLRPLPFGSARRGDGGEERTISGLWAYATAAVAALAFRPTGEGDEGREIDTGQGREGEGPALEDSWN
ncbi:hypothetical protein GUJ93_ZPchr0014g47560 [Zizania palustris]|uniref:Uncharacterized protein n=1 Tax=Zizania palustris TaxID=103762 RepID=A0A8J5SY03_ZIZPA|nr:hypothetical protein GUJ93_ZPchr0014g47560 [Zizania palustris]